MSSIVQLEPLTARIEMSNLLHQSGRVLVASIIEIPTSQMHRERKNAVVDLTGTRFSVCANFVVAFLDLNEASDEYSGLQGT